MPGLKILAVQCFMEIRKLDNLENLWVLIFVGLLLQVFFLTCAVKKSVVYYGSAVE